ncbi:MAG TPA: hypothetical protein VM052_01440, partial [Candidatus Limnocylindrales bacterium]|nr:hypothetical protein [Candidatus Limnocylindrales bacterium]
DPKWRKDQMTDRRGTLRKFETVEHALEDRAKNARAAKTGPAPKRAAPANTKTVKAKAKER